MKAKLEFNLDDHDDRQAHLRCVKSSDLCFVLWDILQDRKKFEWMSEEENISPDELVDKFYEQINEHLNNYNVDLNELIS